ncbi:hypothetical protein BLNAU_15375 [Blattamonas nauphoetae]|uniref:GP-PDE domain-containing protein n=1 Tax=Blattamonas nauphoetae TaxID=2049346 RepID=A0ABQ9XFS3_9EUKA|nr:hypothetical protein BLNAU_15375 [Blattamonas nauphoetae]
MPVFSLFLLPFLHSVRIIGHRGDGCSQINCVSEYPENSIPSALHAIKVGADVVELDVWLSKDDELMISHRNNPNGTKDDLFASITPGVGTSTPRPDQFEYKKRNVYPMKAAWSKDKRPRQEYLSDKYNVAYNPIMPLPTLGEYFDAVCPTGKKIVVEMKGDDARLGPRIIAEIERRDVFDCIHAISSFEWNVNNTNPHLADLFEPIRYDTRVQRALLYGGTQKTSNDFILTAAKYYNAHFIHLNCNALDANWQSTINKARAQGLESFCYYGGGIDTYSHFDKAMSYGVDEICTNNPALLYQYLHPQSPKRTK